MEEEELMRIKSRIMIMLCIALCIMTVGFAAFSTTLTITGTANIASTWKVVFTSIEEVSKTSGVTITETPAASGTTATFNVDLEVPGDKIVYRITIANQGTLDAVINEIKASETGSDAILFELANINQGDILEAGDTTTFEVTIKYDENITSQPNITDNQLTVTINYVQSVGQSITPSVPVIQVERLSAATLRHNTPKSDAGIDFSKTSEEDGTKGLYYTNINTEDNRTTYYFRGAVENNYVKFGSYGEEACLYYDHPIYAANLDSGEIDTATRENCSSTNVCMGNFVGFGENECKEVTNDFLGGVQPTCSMGGHMVMGVGEDGEMTVEISKETCESLPVCLIELDEVWVGMSGDELTKKTCESAAGIWTGTTGTYVGNNYNPYSTLKANYEKKALLWRIVRINEDGSVRIITDNAVGSSAFNTDNDDNAYVGYMYGTPGSSTYDETHANEHDSTIKEFLDDWYTNNLSQYSNLISTEAGFCNDRSLYSGAGAGNSSTYYGAYNRLANLYKPQFKCPNASHDLFTMNTSSKGNKKLTKPIGLITADEMAYAGGVAYEFNNSYYLNYGEFWWTMSPRNFSGDATAWREYAGHFGNGDVDSSYGVHPVINLSSNVQITGGNGTRTTPYVVKVD